MAAASAGAYDIFQAFRCPAAAMVLKAYPWTNAACKRFALCNRVHGRGCWKRDAHASLLSMPPAHRCGPIHIQGRLLVPCQRRGTVLCGAVGASWPSYCEVPTIFLSGKSVWRRQAT
mmetsp:Transcript_42233/g.122531  ORF Transcript_42233/g.122531 Transcript_42233/m.122531 type:complete len:117 (+) Transcript_42233:1493-1843(+)